MDDPEAVVTLALYHQLAEIRTRIRELTAEETRASKRVADGVDGADLTLAQLKFDVEALYQRRDHLDAALS